MHICTYLKYQNIYIKHVMLDQSKSYNYGLNLHIKDVKEEHFLIISDRPFHNNTPAYSTDNLRFNLWIRINKWLVLVRDL